MFYPHFRAKKTEDLSHLLKITQLRNILILSCCRRIKQKNSINHKRDFETVFQSSSIKEMLFKFMYDRFK